MFIKPLYKAVSARVSRLDTATIKIGGFEWTSSELDSVLVEREILKSAILMAAIDENFSEPEKLFVENRASSMVDRLGTLSDHGRRKVLHESINMAAADKIIRKEEYRALRLRAAEYGTSEEELNRQVIEKCLQSGTEPPPELRALHERTLERLDSV